MTGPEHYREAERLIAMARDEGGASGGMYSWHETQPAMVLADAQVHAILALAAATALGSSRDWHEVPLAPGSRVTSSRGATGLGAGCPGAPPAGRAHPPAQGTSIVRRRGRLGALIHEYVQAA